jgi:hypothetical protein
MMFLCLMVLGLLNHLFVIIAYYELKSETCQQLLNVIHI